MMKYYLLFIMAWAGCNFSFGAYNDLIVRGPVVVGNIPVIDKGRVLVDSGVAATSLTNLVSVDTGYVVVSDSEFDWMNGVYDYLGKAGVYNLLTYSNKVSAAVLEASSSGIWTVYKSTAVRPAVAYAISPTNSVIGIYTAVGGVAVNDPSVRFFAVTGANVLMKYYPPGSDSGVAVARFVALENGLALEVWSATQNLWVRQTEWTED